MVENKEHSFQFPKVKPKRDELEPETIPMFQYGEDSGSVGKRE